MANTPDPKTLEPRDCQFCGGNGYQQPTERLEQCFPCRGTGYELSMATSSQAPIFDSDLRELCVILGWQGGTVHQVKAEVKRLVSATDPSKLVTDEAAMREAFEVMARRDLGYKATSLRDNGKYINGQLQGAWNAWKACWNHLTPLIASLKSRAIPDGHVAVPAAEMEALQRDAARYRWSRRADLTHNELRILNENNTEALDAAIDAAMEKTHD